MSVATFVYADYSPFNTSHYRVLIPAKYLQQAGHEIIVCHQSELTDDKISEVMLIERELRVARIDTLRSLGVKRIIFTFDDAYRNLPRNMASWGYWRGETGVLADLRPVIDKVDAVIVPSARLAREYHAQVMHNYHDPDLWKDLPEKTEDRLVIGWGGSTGHYVTFQNVVFANAIKRISNEFPNVVFRMFGNVADDALFSVGARAERRGWVDFENWPREIAQFDIGLAPISGKYDQYRSNLKLVEYGLAGIPFVASEMDEYSGAQGGLIMPTNEKAWIAALRRLIKDSDLRKFLGARGREWAETYWMPLHVAAYERLLWGS